MNHKISLKLAKSLYQAALKNKQTEKIFDQLNGLLELFNDESFINNWSRQSTLDKEQLIKLTNDTFGKDLNDILKNLWVMLVASNCLNELPVISKYYQNIYFKEENIANFEIITANKLDEKLTKEITSKIESNKKQKVYINFNTDNSLIGGMQIFENGILTDHSLSAKLNKLRKEIISYQ